MCPTGLCMYSDRVACGAWPSLDAACASAAPHADFICSACAAAAAAAVLLRWPPPLLPCCCCCCNQVLEQLAAESLAPTACTTIEEVGSTGVGALTIAFLILGVSTIVFISRVGSAKSQKVYYYCNVFVCGFATMSYFAMLSGQGWTAIAGCRQFFYARYVDWSITTPLLLLDLGLIAGADPALIAAAIGADCEFLCAYSLMGCRFLLPCVSWKMEEEPQGDSVGTCPARCMGSEGMGPDEIDS